MKCTARGGVAFVGLLARLSPVHRDFYRSPTEMNRQSTDETDDAINAAVIWAYVLPIAVFVAGAVYISQLDYGSREQVLIAGLYVLVPICFVLGVIGRYATRLGFLLVATNFCSGLLYSGDMGGGWSHGVAGGMTTANAIVAGIVLLVTVGVRKRVTRSSVPPRRADIADYHKRRSRAF